MRVLESDGLSRSEKALGIARWFLRLHNDRVRYSFQGKDCKTPRHQLDNLVWLAVATAPPGFCHVKNEMTGTLFEDVLAGLPFDAIKRRWDTKMHPLQYQRPTKEVSEGVIKQANELVAKLAAEGSLARCHARLGDIQQILGSGGAASLYQVEERGQLRNRVAWFPDPIKDNTAEVEQSGKPFDRLLKGKAATVKPVELPPRKIGWERFRDEVLPTARRLELLVPGGRAGFFGLVTAVDPQAPPILQWDGLTTRVEYETDPPQIVDEPLPRNPVSWYFYHGGSYASGWNLNQGVWANVTAVTTLPPHWQRPDKFKHMPQMALFVLEGCHDQSTVQTVRGFFPESLRSEFHGIRAAMEAYARTMTLGGREESTANGLALAHGEQDGVTVRVTGADGGVETFQIHWRKDD